jgi:hypothetical protein
MPKNRKQKNETSPVAVPPTGERPLTGETGDAVAAGQEDITAKSPDPRREAVSAPSPVPYPDFTGHVPADDAIFANQCLASLNAACKDIGFDDAAVVELEAFIGREPTAPWQAQVNHLRRKKLISDVGDSAELEAVFRMFSASIEVALRFEAAAAEKYRQEQQMAAMGRPKADPDDLTYQPNDDRDTLSGLGRAMVNRQD